MLNLNFNESHFLASSTLIGSMDLPESGVVLLTGDNGVGKSTFCSYLYEKKLLPQNTIWTESNQFRSIYPITVNSILVLFRENAEEINLDRYQALYSLFKISQWSERTWSELSSGQGQMLKLLMGLCLSAKCYLLDEPAHFLDKDKLNSLSKIITDLSENSLVIIIDHRIDWFQGELNSRYQLSQTEKMILLERV